MWACYTLLAWQIQFSNIEGKKSLIRCTHKHCFLNTGEITFIINRCMPLDLLLTQGGVSTVYICVSAFNRFQWIRSPDPPLLVLQLNSWILVWVTQQETQCVQALKLNHSEFMEEIGAFSLHRLLFQDTESLNVLLYMQVPSKKCLLR